MKDCTVLRGEKMYEKDPLSSKIKDVFFFLSL